MNNARRPSDLFTEFKVNLDSNDPYRYGENNKQIKIITLKTKDNESILPSNLPYAGFFTSSYLNSAKIQAQRVSECIVIARGDSRLPEEIFSSGGFHPQFTNPLAQDKARTGDDILDVAKHREDSPGSGLVSCSSNMHDALTFSAGKDDRGAVYFVKVRGAIDPGKVLDSESEYSVPGGMDAEDIVAYRLTSLGLDETGRTVSGFHGSSIFISHHFLKNYPGEVNTLIDNFLQHNETCLNRPGSSEQLQSKIQSKMARS
jgi:hypothetical protein